MKNVKAAERNLFNTRNNIIGTPSDVCFAIKNALSWSAITQRMNGLENSDFFMVKASYKKRPAKNRPAENRPATNRPARNKPAKKIVLTKKKTK